MNYKLIQNETILKNFIDFLPELNKDECYYVTMFARKKYNATIKSDYCIKRFTSIKEHLIDKIKQLECEIGVYKCDGVPVPEDSLALYITVNPRSLIKASKATVKEMLDKLLSDNNIFNPQKLSLINIQKSCSRTVYFDFDFDNINIEEIKDDIKLAVNEDAAKILHTRGGFHLLIELDKIDEFHKKGWHQNMSKIKNVDAKGDNLIPIPGCRQGDSMPYMLNAIFV